jgi:transcriptional regulator with XRE-family HTH domain
MQVRVLPPDQVIKSKQYTMTVNEAYRKKRKLSGISRIELASRTGISKYKIELYERNITHIPDEHIELIRSAINSINEERLKQSNPVRMQFIALRKAKGLTHKTLSEASNVNTALISNFENGKHSITLSVLERMTNAMQVEIRLIDEQ